jgi:hypothetical protein
LAREDRKLNSRARKLILLALALVIAAAAVVVFLNRDAIADKFSSAGSTGSQTQSQPYTFEAGSQQVYAAVGNGAALASTNSLQLLDSSGNSAARQVLSMKTPALTASDSSAAAFDVGGTEVCVADLEGKCTDIDNTDVVINARMNADGWLALCTEATGYKGRVTVYNEKQGAVYRWNSGEGYLIGASVSPDNKYMAALCVGSDGSTVHIFALSSEKEHASFKVSGSLLIDLTWLENDRLFLLSQTGCTSVDRDGKQAGSYDFGGQYLTDYSFGGSGFVVLMLGKYRTGGTGSLTAVGADCKLMGQTEINSELLYLSCRGKTAAALCQDGLRLYTQSMTQTGTDGSVSGVKAALVRDRGDVLLISSYSAEVRSY